MPANTRHSFSATHLTDPVVKQATRERTLRLVQRTWHWHENALTGDWLELCGDGDETLKMLLAQHALQPGKGRYIGINSDPDVIRRNQNLFAAETTAGLCEWVCSSWADAILAYPNTGVLVFDGFNSLNNGHLDQLLLPSLSRAQYLQQQLGQVVLVLNFALRGVKSRDLTPYQHRLEQDLAVPISDRDFHVYTCKRTPMCMCWIGFGV